LRRARIIAEQTALHGVVLDAMNDRARDIYEKLGFLRFQDDAYKLYLPIGTILQLPPNETDPQA
jgi:hypothetical protein